MPFLPAIVRNEPPAAEPAPYVIEQDIPVPKARAQPRKYPFARMGAGDSFFVAEPDTKCARTLSNRIRTSATALGFKITCRCIEGGVRVWRIE